MSNYSAIGVAMEGDYHIAFPKESLWKYLIPLQIAMLLALFFTYLRRIQFSYRKMPPGPPVLPILGTGLSLLALQPFKWQDLFSWKSWECFHLASKKYGGLFSVSIGKFTGVVFTSYELMREVENMDEYSIKISNELTVIRSHGEELGLIFAATPELWIEMRKFSQRTLRDFGFGKRHSMQSAIESEITQLLAKFKSDAEKTGGILTIRSTFMLSVINVLWCMLAGQQYSHDDPKLTSLLRNVFLLSKCQTFVDPALLAFPALREWFPKLFKFDENLKTTQECHDFSQSLIDERRAEGMYKSEPQNYIDCFLKKIEENKNNPKTVYTDKNMQIMIEDFLQTGSLTSNATLNYGVLFLTLNSDVQKRCQEEIDAIVPRHLIPTLDDIEKMPYFQATILENHRLASVVPIPVPRMAPVDWHFKGYVIPKDTIILSNHYSVLMDEDYWKDPQNFRPDRFIDENGKFVPNKRVVHFGFGKRYCIGVALSNSVIPIYIATLIQNFNLSVVPGTKPPTRECEIGASLSPKEFQCLITPRN